MTEPSRFAGQRSQPACFHRQGRAWRFLEKSSSLRSGIFPENLACGGGLQESPRKRNGIPLKHEDYESKRTHQKDSGQQMGKNPRVGRHGSRHFSWIYTHGISPVWTAVAIICFRGFFRFLYRVACLLVALAILLCILSFLVF